MSISSAYSTAVTLNAEQFSGQAGNAVPIVGPGSSDVLFLDYGIMAGFHRPIKKLVYDAAGISVGSSLSGAFCYYDGPAATAGAGFIFSLPDPQPGLWFEIAGVGAIGCTVATIFNCESATGAFYIGGDSGGTDGVTFSGTTADQLIRMEFIGLSTAKYMASYKLGGSSVPLSTAAFVGATASS